MEYEVSNMAEDDLIFMISQSLENLIRVNLVRAYICETQKRGNFSSRMMVKSRESHVDSEAERELEKVKLKT